MKKLVFLSLFSILLLLNNHSSYSQTTDLKKELHIYQAAFINPVTPQDQLNRIIQRYKDLFIKVNSIPVEQEVTPSGQEAWLSPLASHEQDEQNTILQSLRETLIELQNQGTYNRVKKILDDIIIANLNQTSDISSLNSYPDPTSYKNTIKVFRIIKDYEDPIDSTQDISIPHYYEIFFKKYNTSLSDKAKELEKNLDGTLTALNKDFSNNLSKAVAQLQQAEKILQYQILTLASIWKTTTSELLGRTLDTTKTSEERLMAIQTLLDVMMNIDRALYFDEATKRQLLDFLEAYKKSEKQKGSKKNQPFDKEKWIKQGRGLDTAREYLIFFGTRPREKNSINQRLENVKYLIAQIEKKIDAALRSDSEPSEEGQ